MSILISVVIPACDAGQHLARCLEALGRSTSLPFETIVVDDGSKDNTRDIATARGAIVLSTGERRGPAFARNLGAKRATGEILLFLDSDVCVKPETLTEIGGSFAADPELDALMGSYDTEPYSWDFLSQYRNLMHSYVHQTGAQQASTFWSGCGAIRREIFLTHSGFDEGYGRPAIEDIELGYRLIRAGRKIILDGTIQVTHLKRWTFWALVKTDILDRGIPWTELILRDHFMPNDLNLQLSQRVSVALVFILVGLVGTMAVLSGPSLMFPLFAIVFLMLARWWGELGIYKNRRQAYVMLVGMISVIAAVAYSDKMYGLILPLVVSPVLLLLRHRYRKHDGITQSHRRLGLFFICGSVAVAAFYLPTNPLLFASFVVLAILGLLNSQFYVFLAGNRGTTFMLAAIPFHLLYHFYNGFSFLVGLTRHYLSGAMHKSRRLAPPLP